MRDDDTACMPVGQCRALLVELQAVRLRVTALEQAVADYVRAIDDAALPPAGAARASASGQGSTDRGLTTSDHG